jgi:hypothetical protein
MKPNINYFSAAFMLAVLQIAAGQTVPQVPLPQRQGHEFVVEDWNGKVTRNDLGFNHFGGNQGTVDVPVAGITTLALAADRVADAKGRALRLAVNFEGVGDNGLGGIFVSLNGLTDTLVSLDGTTPATTTKFPGYFADFDDFFRGFQPWAGRSIEKLRFNARLAPGSPPLAVKVELKDEDGRDVFVRVLINSENWGVASLPRALFAQSVTSDPAAFDWRRVSQCALLVEEFVAGEVANPSGGFEIDDLRLEDTDGLYADLDAAANPDGTLQTRYRDAFLDLASRLAMLYFRDFSSTDPRTGGLICDRSSFADLMTVGGVPYQLTAWIAAAERGAIPHAEARARTLALLRVLAGGPQGPEPLGRIGHRGFFYHFLGIDGRRKTNFDFPETPAVNEALNTVELSLIDTALAAAGITIAREFWLGGDAEETEIRALADTMLGRIDWPFMLHAVGGKQQFALGWKPNETRDDSGPYGRFALADADGLGHFSSKMVNGVETPATLDYMTSEGLLAALLAMASPNPAFRLGPEVWNDMIREGTPFVKSWPGSLFTYTWFNQFVDTKRLGPDNHPLRPADWFANTAAAITAVRNAAANNPTGMISLGAGFSGMNPCEGPFDFYSANAFAATAIADTPPGSLNFECENATGDGDWVWRGAASGLKTRRLETPGVFSTPFNLPATIPLRAVVRYSNDGGPDNLTVRADSQSLGAFTTVSTGGGGHGWNIFANSLPLGPATVSAGAHTLELEVASTDFYGVEPDVIKLYGPLESGTFTAYGVAEQLPWADMDAVNELFRLASFDLNGDGKPPLFQLRLGMSDAFQLEIAEALTGHGLTGTESFILRNAGPWSNQTGFAIDLGPTALTISNSMMRGLFQSLFAKNAGVAAALTALFPTTKSPFGQWTLDHFGSTTEPAAAPDADPDHDGSCNLIEYATGGDPRQASPVQAAVSRQDAEVVLSLPVDLAAVVNIAPEMSLDLQQWTAIASTARRVGQSGGGIVTMEWRVPSDAASAFFRLRATVNP